jgi:hypothetical protein
MEIKIIQYLLLTPVYSKGFHLSVPNAWAQLQTSQMVDRLRTRAKQATVMWKYCTEISGYNKKTDKDYSPITHISTPTDTFVLLVSLFYFVLFYENLLPKHTFCLH